MSNRFKYTVVTFSSCLLALLLLGGVLGPTKAAEDAYRHFAVYSEVLSHIKSSYVEEPDLKSVTLGALNGLLESLDPYASYLNADQYKQYMKSKEGRKADVGLVLSRRFGYVGVVESVPDSPAQKAGLNTGDVLEAIDGIATRDMPLAYAELLLKGEPGTSVKLSVLRFRRGADAEQITLIRAPIRMPAPSSSIAQEGVGLLKIPSFEASQVKDFAGRLSELSRQGAEKLVIDLRNNAFTSPEDGITLANLFIEKGLITYLLGQKYPRKDFEADPARVLYRKPIVVLVNRGTAGGAEIAAAAVLDARRAEVVGERSYGDAAMRRAINLDDGSAVLLSVAKYYSPSGKAIQDQAVTPSVAVLAVEPEPESEEEAPAAPAAPQEDVQLKKAIEVLTKGVAAARGQEPGAVTAQSGFAEPERPITPLHVPRPPRQ